jgi:hypothetical protein
MPSTLTHRRRTALDALRELAATSGGPVHYPEVGARMGVSAWTAYGLLRDLESLGLVRRSYAIAPGHSAGGRSRILFAPSAPAAGEEPESENRLRTAFERFAAIADETAAVRAYVADTRDDLAYHLGFWMARLDAAGRSAQDAGRALLEGGALPSTKLQAIAALGLGSTLARLEPERLAGRLTEATGRLTVLLEGASRVPDGRLAALVDAARRLATSVGQSDAARPSKRIVT